MRQLGILVGAAGDLDLDHGVAERLLAAEEAQPRVADDDLARVLVARRKAGDGSGDARQLARPGVAFGVRGEAAVGGVDDDHLQIAVVPDDLDRDAFFELLHHVTFCVPRSQRHSPTTAARLSTTNVR